MVTDIKKIFFSILFLIFIFVLSACGAAKAPAKQPAVAAPTGLTMAVVAEHNSSTDCWLTVNNNIYNVTDHLAPNPSGEAAMAAYCGRDATTVFDADEKNSGQPIFDIDRQTLEQFYIGSLAR